MTALLAIGGPAHGRRFAAASLDRPLIVVGPDRRVANILRDVNPTPEALVPETVTYTARRVLLPGWRVTFRVWWSGIESEPGQVLPGSVYGVPLESCRGPW